MGARAGKTDVTCEASDVHLNCFNLPVAFTAVDFASLDEAGPVKPRRLNGDLPDVPFLRLAAGSAAIDRGVERGRPFSGSAPDRCRRETTKGPENTQVQSRPLPESRAASGSPTSGWPGVVALDISCASIRVHS